MRPVAVLLVLALPTLASPALAQFVMRTPAEREVVPTRTTIVVQNVRDSVAVTRPDTVSALAMARADETPAGGLLTRAGAGLTDDRAYALTSIYTGYVSANLFIDFSIAHAVSNRDSSDATLSRAEFRRRIADVLTIMQNGGAAAARAVGQWSSDPDVKHRTWGAAAVHLNAGAVGLVGENATKRFAAGGGLEAQGSLRLRNKELTKVEGELYLGGRLGYQFVSGGVLSNVPDKTRLPFAQFVLQLRAAGTTLFGVSANVVGRTFDPYVQPVQITAATAF